MLGPLFQTQYDFEHQRRSELTSSASSPIVAITVVSSAVAVALLDFPYTTTLLSIAFVVLAAATLTALFASVYFVFRSIWNYIYRKLPPATSLAAHLSELKAWHVARGASVGDVANLAQIDFDEYIAQRLSEAADWNSQNNDRRGNFLHMGTTALAFAIGLFVPTSLLYAYAKATAPDKAHRVELINKTFLTKEQNMSTSSGTDAPASAPAVPAASPSAPASPVSSQVKPVGPSNSEFRTNTEIPRPQANTNKGGS